MPPRKKVEMVEEPLEAQPPAGIVLEEPGFAGEASDVEMRRLVAAAQQIALENELADEEDIPVEVEVVSPSVQVKPGCFVVYVLDRNIIEDLRLSGVGVNSLAMGDAAQALVIKSHSDGSADLRVFVDAEAVPIRRGVKQIPQPSELTLDHVNYFYLEK
jgi:hypothetical protein